MKAAKDLYRKGGSRAGLKKERSRLSPTEPNTTTPLVAGMLTIRPDLTTLRASVHVALYS